jgi:serine/threonine protein kinase
MMTMALGTLHWMAPELLDNKQYSLKVDVYSFAVVMWEICARRTPYFELSNPMAIMKYVTIDKKRPNMTIIDANCPAKLLELIQICWQEDP